MRLYFSVAASINELGCSIRILLTNLQCPAVVKARGGIYDTEEALVLTFGKE
jgi:hypothetical protein